MRMRALALCAVVGGCAVLGACERQEPLSPGLSLFISNEAGMSPCILVASTQEVVVPPSSVWKSHNEAGIGELAIVGDTIVGTIVDDNDPSFMQFFVVDTNTTAVYIAETDDEMLQLLYDRGVASMPKLTDAYEYRAPMQ